MDGTSQDDVYDHVIRNENTCEEDIKRQVADVCMQQDSTYSNLQRVEDNSTERNVQEMIYEEISEEAVYGTLEKTTTSTMKWKIAAITISALSIVLLLIVVLILTGITISTLRNDNTNSVELPSNVNTTSIVPEEGLTHSPINTPVTQPVHSATPNNTTSIVPEEGLTHSPINTPVTQPVHSATPNNTTSIVPEEGLTHTPINTPVTQPVHSATPNNTTVKSCSDLPRNSPSGHYWVTASSGSAILVYCDMTRTCGPITGGWTRIISLDMNQTSSQCPSTLCLNPTPPQTCRTCFRKIKNCSSYHAFPVDVTFSKVCGRIIAYQIGSTNGVSPKRTNKFDGISLIYGMAGQQHIWSFIAAKEEKYTKPSHVCPCINWNDNSIPAPPEFIGNNYFCDTAPLEHAPSAMFYTDDPLWDGAGCQWASTCCSFNNPPWFYRELQMPTIADITMKICLNERKEKEDIAIEKIDIYVQ